MKDLESIFADYFRHLVNGVVRGEGGGEGEAEAT